MKKLIYTGSVDDAFQRIRSRVNNLIANHLPNAWEKLNSAFDLLESEDTEKWSNAVHSCRRILEDLADFVYEPTVDRIFEGQTKPSELGRNNYINRIMAFIEDSKASKTFKELIGANIDLFWERLSSIYQASNKGSHEVISNQEESDRYVVNTYLIVGDILSLWYSDTKPENLIEGLSNNIFYTPGQKQVLMQLYFNSKISPYKLEIKPNYPLGTGTSFLIIFRKDKLDLGHAFDLQYILSSFVSEELKEKEYLHIGTHTFGKNKNPFIIITVGDSIIHLRTVIIEYIPPKSAKDISEKNWKIVGLFGGQTRGYIENDQIYFPYGTQGLGDLYQWNDNKFIEIPQIRE